MSRLIAPPPLRPSSRPVRPERATAARPEVLELIELELRSPKHRPVVLSGERRSGKTMILQQLAQTLPGTFVPVYLDLGGLRQPAAELGAALSQAIGAPAALPMAGAAAAGDPLAHLLPALTALGAERQPVLLLDGFDGLDAGPLRDEGLGLLRALIDDPRLGLVLAIGATADTLSPQARALLRTARHKRLSRLDDSAARRLLTTPAPRPAVFSAPAVDRVLALCAGQPFFITLLRQLLIDAAGPDSPVIVPTIDAHEVEAAESRLLEAADPGASWIWDGFTALEQLVLALLSRAEGRGLSSREELGERIAQLGSNVPPGELAAVLETLVRREHLRERAGRYTVAVEILRRWVAARRPPLPLPPRAASARTPPALPLAAQLHLLGRDLVGRGDLDNALPLLRHALRIDPQAGPARLLLGQVLLESQQLEEAIRELEEVERQDPAAARPLLLRALHAQARPLAEARDDDAALRIYDRILAVSPEDEEAQRGRCAVWLRRADQALLDGDLDRALDAYKEARDPDKAAAVAAMRRKRDIDKAAAEAQQAEWQGAWQEAAERYAWLGGQDPTEARFAEGLARCQAELELRRHYQEGVAALREGNLLASIRALGVVVQTRPDFKDAAERLAVAARRQAGRDTPQAPVKLSRPRPWMLLLGGLAALLLLSVAVLRGRPRPEPIFVAPPPPPPPSPDQIAAGLLLKADLDLLDRRWDRAIAQAGEVLHMDKVSPSSREAAKAKQEQAAREQRAQAAYERFASGHDRDLGAEELVQLHRAIPEGSVYRRMARAAYGEAVAAAAKEHLRRAESARGAGRCWEFRYWIEHLLALEPDHPGAVALFRKRCFEATAPAGRSGPRNTEAKAGAQPEDDQ